MRKEDLIAPEVEFDDLEETLEEEAEEFISETIKNIKTKQTINLDLKNFNFNFLLIKEPNIFYVLYNCGMPPRLYTCCKTCFCKCWKLRAF